MPTKKKLTEEEALKILTQKYNPYMINMDSNGLRKHANEFIKDAGVKPSATDFVTSRLIYWRYLKWCQFKSYKPMTKARLLDGWSKYFKHGIKKSKYTQENGYYIEKTNFIISTEEMEQLCQYEKQQKEKRERKLKRQQKRKEKAVKKKQDEIESLLTALKNDSSQE